jgi:hypothetical protein
MLHMDVSRDSIFREMILIRIMNYGLCIRAGSRDWLELLVWLEKKVELERRGLV